MPIQFLIFNSSSALVEALCQPQRLLEWLHTPTDGTPRILNEGEAFSNIRNGRDRPLQTLGEEPDSPIIPFTLSDSLWLLKNHSHFTISLIGCPGQIDHHYINKNGFLNSLFYDGCHLGSFFKKAYNQSSLNIYCWWEKKGGSLSNNILHF